MMHMFAYMYITYIYIYLYILVLVTRAALEEQLAEVKQICIYR